MIETKLIEIKLLPNMQTTSNTITIKIWITIWMTTYVNSWLRITFRQLAVGITIIAEGGPVKHLSPDSLCDLTGDIRRLLPDCVWRVMA